MPVSQPLTAVRHKPGFIDDLRQVLPVEYVKIKHIEKLVYAEHRRLQGMTDINTKYRYIQVLMPSCPVPSP